MIDRILVKSASRMARNAVDLLTIIRELKSIGVAVQFEKNSLIRIQKLYYTEKIESTPEWEVAGIYADDGISGVHTKKRDGFNQMIQDCKKHRIDLILTKSISRFARNTLDSIQYVRMLKQMGIAVVFEKENINTATMNSEMILTVLSAFAQAESESISQNVARGKRMGYKHGKFAFPYGRIIGYRKGADGKPEIIPEQAEVIRLIFNSYLQGDSLQSIKAKLKTAGALTARGNTAWSAQSIKPNLQEQLEQTQQEFDRLLEMSLDFDEDTPFLDDRLKKLNSKIKRLKKAIEETAAQQEKASQPELLLSARDLQIQEYDDALTARIIEKITVRSRNEIEIRFIGGYEKAMPLE